MRKKPFSAEERAFNPKESMKLTDENVISLATYANRMNIKLLKSSDFNEKLRDRGCQKKVTGQKICRISKHEKEVREVVEAVGKPELFVGFIRLLFCGYD